MNIQGGWRLAGVAAGAVLCLTFASASAQPASGPAPYDVATGLFDPSRPDHGLTTAAGTETFTLFAPTEATDRFSNGVVLIPFKGRLHAMWQASARDEDSADTF